jgi:hypothetical protein
MNEETAKIHDFLKDLVGKKYMRLKSNATTKERLLLGDFIKNFKVNMYSKKPIIIRDVSINEEKQLIKIGFSKEKDKKKEQWDYCIFDNSMFSFDRDNPNNFFIMYNRTDRRIRPYVLTLGFFTLDTPLDKYMYDDEFKALLKDQDNKVLKFENIVLTPDNIDKIRDDLYKKLLNKKCNITVRVKRDSI